MDIVARRLLDNNGKIGKCLNFVKLKIMCNSSCIGLGHLLFECPDNYAGHCCTSDLQSKHIQFMNMSRHIIWFKGENIF